jgi:phosphoribosylaminoimidazolecarboxamide formyltransferase/IMP cyclohydrolase
MVNPALADLSARSLDRKPRFRYVRGGALVQPNYDFILNFDHPELKVYGKRSESCEDDLRLAWAIGSTANSNTITLAIDGMLIGNGVGQQDRVGAAELAIKRAKDAGHPTVGAVAYSDSFFPFVDGPAALIASGIKAIFSSSGSVNDAKVQALCQAADVTLYQLPDKLARGFFGH